VITKSDESPVQESVQQIEAPIVVQEVPERKLSMENLKSETLNNKEQEIKSPKNQDHFKSPASSIKSKKNRNPYPDYLLDLLGLSLNFSKDPRTKNRRRL